MKKSVFILILFFLLNYVVLNAKGLPNEYYQIKNNQEQKDYFFQYLYKLVKKENIEILKERKFIYSFLNTNILKINYHSGDFSKLLFLKEKYRIKNLLSVQEYLEKIDIIPPSIALSQAAVESGWGKSRFIKIANNIFGHWTYDENNGIVPKKRNPKDKHLIRVFNSLSDSIKKYMLNLNSNKAYRQLHINRYKQRQNSKLLNGIELSQTLINYSGIGKEYLKILKNVIIKNNLEEFDRRFYKTLTNYNSFKY